MKVHLVFRTELHCETFFVKAFANYDKAKAYTTWQEPSLRKDEWFTIETVEVEE